MVVKFAKAKSGIFVPHDLTKQPVGVQCGFCPAVIFQHMEAGGRLFMHRGKTPICARCRILKGSKFAKQIRRDKKLYEKDLKVKETLADNKERMRVAEIAHESQKRASVDSDSKKRKLHR